MNGVLRSSPKPKKRLIFCHRRRIGKFCRLFSTQQRPNVFVSDAWPAPTTYHRSFCEHCTVTRRWVGAPNERAPSRFHAAVVGFVDRCPSRTRNSPRPINIWLSFFSGRSWPKICPAITFFGVSEKFKTFLRRFVLIASGTEIFWRESLKFKLFLATSRFRCHRSQRQSLSWPLSQLQSDSHQLYVCNISMQPLHTSPPFSCGGLPSKT